MAKINDEIKMQIKILQLQENMSYSEAKKRIEQKYDTLAKIY